MAVKSGVHAVRTAASPLAICVWPQRMRLNGMRLLRTAMIAKGAQPLSERGSR